MPPRTTAAVEVVTRSTSTLSRREAPVVASSVLAWATCVIVPAWPSEASLGALGMSSAVLVPAIAGSFLVRTHAAVARSLLLLVAPLALLAAVLGFDLGPGLSWSWPVSMAGTAGFVTYLAFATAFLDEARSTRADGTNAPAADGDERVVNRARRRTGYVAWIAASAFSLVAIAPTFRDAGDAEARWGVKHAEGRVLAALFGLAIAMFLALGVAAPAQKKLREPTRSRGARFALALTYAAFAALVYVALLGR